MLRIISPHEFREFPWKNGQGSTIELAINSGGTAENFDWRLSIATIANNGPFSNFSGYTRDQVLLSGNGMRLVHDNNTADQFNRPFDKARYSGDSQTVATLVDGPVTAFNLITHSDRIQANLAVLDEANELVLPQAEQLFIYAPDSPIHLSCSSTSVPAGYLISIDQCTTPTTVTGKQFILISLDSR
ncbi:HutD family protein [Porticoccaceae bacterium LTM1]|nr:HutD family protein [Porticoccaceae bacterium LTM1]